MKKYDLKAISHAFELDLLREAVQLLYAELASKGLIDAEAVLSKRTGPQKVLIRFDKQNSDPDVVSWAAGETQRILDRFAAGVRQRMKDA